MNTTTTPTPDELQAIATRVVQHFGTQTAVAHALGYSDLRNVTPWTTGKRPFGPKQCVQLERASGGALKRQELRPHDFADHWPDLASSN